MSTLLGILAILSAAAAAGMRIALPLLIVGLIQGQLWSEVPLLWRVNPQVVVAVLTSWSLFELFGSKKLLGQRVLQIVQLLFTPLVGAMMAITVARLLTSELASQLEMDFRFPPLWVVGAIGSLFALAIRLVAIGWFFRLRGLPFWVTVLEDLFSVGLVLFAFKAPKNGGLIAILLLWIVVRSSTAWRTWFLANHSRDQPSEPKNRQ
ncbi:slr0779 [Synechocystis sp. PCC 6803]|jgi:hypothetical protein|uniref:Slr0779 protein n=1 Tax=Synechocystis sp. (strain ATCC 27184 / PCC 6803 / Kazusa) TaxID=1111708 RepID=Q55620_SYNY3|nr:MULTISPECIES: DUF4126 domain-containing protein [unclassified Synechocystis]WLT37373.1 DUF4126 domain-containing protein [Synechocystis sp. B12]BAM54529.1 hypothetical protein BEST7613_5598 [Synechocystis sp. PCC 6803] [Bacillus subtilis BEST7613]AGF52425.1 hypothetical protein MYO_121870 [Synechocystis sp. PCC 6803]ALJ68363.1 hypothetical protein AOY38_11265 [Synechocystis sp. PCC 6803]AVP90201.1 DUF4126 domain-containing protein [Synechocystis sp. IPPAS B-1465]